MTTSRNKREGYYVGCACGIHSRQRTFHNPIWKKVRDSVWALDCAFRKYHKEMR